VIVARAVLLSAGLCVAGFAQQPFYTDDADVTERRHYYLEISNQQSWLQHSALPQTIQNTTVFHLNYGLTTNFEIGMDAPFIALYQQDGPPATGPGDLNTTFKLRVVRERIGLKRPAFTLSCAIEVPTGSVHKGLGSGIPDYGCNTVIQKQLGAWTLRVNNGMVFSGNTLTGDIGLRVKGLVYTGGGSITRNVLPRLLVGAEINGSAAAKTNGDTGTNTSDLGKANLQVQVGSKFTITDGFTLDFGVMKGWFSGSPKWQLQLGFSKDF
jgi:hypothetical protein